MYNTCPLACPHSHREEMNDRFERAAAIAVFRGNIKLAISTLRNGAATAVTKEDTSSGCGMCVAMVTMIY